MRIHSFVLVALYVLAVEAASHKVQNPGHSRRFSVSHSKRGQTISQVNRKKCRTANNSAKGATSNNVVVNSTANKASGSNSSNNNKQTVSVQIKGTIGGLLNVDSTCGDIGATNDISNTAGPNGAMYWINCGVDNDGWRPQNVGINDLKVVELSAALQDPNSPFKACSPYMDKFIQYANEFNIPPIVMASFAMQESTCNPATVGGGGEVGLMQITPDKCGGAPGGNCFDPDFNIRTGTAFFKSVLDQSGGNALQAIGMYNGWKPGMTIASATAAASSSCCKCQNNLDYLFQMLNGWFQNVDPYTRHLGQYFNLDVCH